MSDKVTPFVVNDRRKFTHDGELRPESERSHTPEETEPVAAPPAPVASTPEPAAELDETQEEPQEEMPPALTEEQIEQARMAYEATAERLDIAIRAANPGMEHMPPMSFDRLVQSIYMTAIMQLGGGTREGEQPRVDIIGARQSTDMLAVLAQKTEGNLSEAEDRLLQNALFELRMGFLEITQVLSRQARQNAEEPLPPPPGGGPRIVR